MENPRIVQREGGLGAQLMAGMSYLGILALVPLILNRDDSYIRFHSRQGLVLWIWEVLAVFCLVIPGIGRIIFQYSSLFCFLFSVLGLISVALGRAWRIPWVSSWADKL